VNKDERAEYMRNRRAARVAAGICVNCQNPAAPKMKRCQACEDKNREGVLRYRARQKSNGRCDRCGREKSGQFLMCADCRHKQRTRRADQGTNRLTAPVSPRTRLVHEVQLPMRETYSPPKTPRRVRPIWETG